MTRSLRLARYETVSTRLALLSDRDLAALLAGATTAGTGIGGATAMLDLDGVPVFVKQVPLTDLERRPEHLRSTANLFGLPTFYQYGIGSAGFGVWRELAVHVMTTNWVLTDQCPGFPLLYHWRTLPRVPVPPTPEDRAELEYLVGYWEASPAVRARLTALTEASASVVLFTEYVPQTVSSWLRGRSTEYSFVERSVRAGVAFMNAHGLLHFDAHFDNLLTDGRRVYFADFGLAVHSGFALSDEETAFLRRHLTYDRFATAMYLVQWLVTNVCGVPRADWDGRCATTTRGSPPCRPSPPGSWPGTGRSRS